MRHLAASTCALFLLSGCAAQRTLRVTSEPPGATVREATYEGVRAAYEAHLSDCEALEESARNIDEIQRLMQGFAGELRKLEEGLQKPWDFVEEPTQHEEGWRNYVEGKGEADHLIQGIPVDGLPDPVYKMREGMGITDRKRSS